MNFSENLANVRRSKNLTQAEIARQAGIPVRSYQRYESGEQEPTLSKLTAIADALGVSIDELVGRNSSS